MRRLVDASSDFIRVGTVFAFPVHGHFAGEPFVELMLCACPTGDMLFEFYPISGYESGTYLAASVPADCYPGASRDGLKAQWIIDNWYRRIFPESNLDEVVVYRRPALPALKEWQS